jgi:hypothetical protein
VTAIAWPSQPVSRPTTPALATHAPTHAAHGQPRAEAPAAQTPIAAVPEQPPVARPAAGVTVAAPDTAHGADPELRREIAQLARIKALVDADPARAYRLAQQGDRAFARGMLRQEREALAIVALANSGHRAQAERRMRDFLLRYPNSPARERLQHVLAAASE